MKVIFTLCFLLTSIILFSQTPANDDCSGLINLGEIPYCSTPGQYTNIDATASNIDPVLNLPDCFDDVDRDVWFQFMVPNDGSILDVSISVFGDIDGNGTLRMPEVAIYRGDCSFGGLAELDCAKAGLDINVIQLDQFGLTPGLPYFLRIKDQSATAASNAGTFQLCIEKYVPQINIGTAAGTQSCTGTLFDTGGPDNDYSNGDDDTFTICPSEFHQCIILNVVNYQTEATRDYLQIYEGSDLTGNQITQLAGMGQNLEIQVPSNCATIRFVADGSSTFSGFEMTWACSSSPCTAPPITTCDAPTVIPALPYTATNLSNCLSGNTITGGPCDDDFLSGNDYIFAYASPGDECVHVNVTGTDFGAGIGIYSLCPSLAGATCIASAGGGESSIDPMIQAAFLENPGTYYLVFGAGADCSTFNISVDTVTCPVVLPPASSCDQALNIGGCSNLLPEIIALNPGSGDPGFIQQGVNAGCFNFSYGNFSFFYFTAGADGKFGFIAQAADPLESSDIDFSMWGPIDNLTDLCDFVNNNQPVRSSWAGYEEPGTPYLTGMADTHPITGLPVNDNFDCGDPSTPGPNPPSNVESDDFVRRLDVQEGKIYVILLDDFGQAIEQSGIAMDFSGTTDGVLGAPDSEVIVSGDTAVCLGQPVQLHATGGVAYFWSPETGLSCNNCPDPLATINASTTYEVQVLAACKTTSQLVEVQALDVHLGPDVTVCNGADFQLNPHPFDNVQYAWTGSPGLSCTDCPSPQVTGLPTGVYMFIATLTTPQCVRQDTVQVTVVNGQQPQYNIIEDSVICKGESVVLGGAFVSGTFYAWTSVPSGLNSSVADPSVTPNVTTTYYLQASNSSCPVSALDSVQIQVYQPPVLAVHTDTAVCDGSSVLLSTTTAEPGITYAWTPDNGSLDDATSPTPTATPLQTTLYTLTATNPGCTEIRHVQVVIVPLSLELNVADTALLCLGGSLPIQATVNPAGTAISWSPLSNLQINPNGTEAIASPNESTLYTAKVVLPGCTRIEKVFVQVDSLPENLAIAPVDTSICQGGKVILRSPVYEPGDFKHIEFEWLPLAGQLTPDSLYNLVVQPTETTVYQRITTHGACTQTDSVKVTVIPPAEMNIVPSDTTVCAGKSVLLHLTYTPGITEIMWMPAESLSCSNCDNPTATPTTTTTYQVSGKFQGCSTGTSALVNVRALPAYHFPDRRMLCAGESLQLSDISDVNANYTWTSTDPNFGTVTDPHPTIIPTQNATYFLHADNGCSVDDQFSITITNGSIQVFGDTTICKGAATSLSATSTVPGTFQWNQGAGSGSAVSVMPLATTTYVATFNFGSNCQLMDSVTVTVAGELAAVHFPTDLELCPGESIQLNDSLATPGATYVWSSVPAGFSSTQANPSATPEQNTKYTVVTTLGNCVNTQTVNVIVYNGVTLTVSNDTTVCAGESVNLIANGSASGSILWTWPLGDTIASQFLVHPTGNTTYQVLYTYGDDCTLTDSVKVKTVANFSAEIIATPDTNSINLGESIELFGKVSPSQNLTGFHYTWFENNVQLNPTTEIITAKPEITDSTVTYLVEIVSPAGCRQTASLTFRLIQPKVRFPNVFTPNGDDVNGTFKMLVVEGFATIDRMEIYNRWGQKVFTSTDPAAEWNGQVDGKDAPSDVYACTVRWRRGDGSLQIYVGEITLLR